MKLFLPILSLASAQTEQDRVWNPDTTLKVDLALTTDALTSSWSVPRVNGVYEPNQYQRVTVTAPSGYKIRVDFSNFNLQGQTYSGGCSNDAAIIFDGPDGNNELTKYCGRGNRNSLTSTGTTLTVVFKSNEDTIVDSGFNALFTAVPLPSSAVAWTSITDAFNSLSSTIFTAYDSTNLNKQSRKATRFMKYMGIIANFQDRSPSSCNDFAGTGHAGSFTPPVIDGNVCNSLKSFFDAVMSYHDIFVCLDGVDYSANPTYFPPRMISKLQRQPIALITRILVLFNIESERLVEIWRTRDAVAGLWACLGCLIVASFEVLLGVSSCSAGLRYSDLVDKFKARNIELDLAIQYPEIYGHLISKWSSSATLDNDKSTTRVENDDAEGDVDEGGEEGDNQGEQELVENEEGDD
ncbi:Oidioi.mRNA.OKI2018_I69.chr1.g226.t1.cds [Oikopleura dioica]|uniref:Oidioi.mRNA.OKI2018_I69.chr1.g226.t1.cds n=1 Tax=Oikopleura dioica TaxID=34765 RepID=A0ABN7SMX4_OIKDI|nr:Oidioi.mRNA.OKI2018_I69.chr1.g226.t1.cds [Oikopleura dioica]